MYLSLFLFPSVTFVKSPCVVSQPPFKLLGHLKYSATVSSAVPGPVKKKLFPPNIHLDHIHFVFMCVSHAHMPAHEWFCPSHFVSLCATTCVIHFMPGHPPSAALTSSWPRVTLSPTPLLQLTTQETSNVRLLSHRSLSLFILSASSPFNQSLPSPSELL